MRLIDAKELERQAKEAFKENPVVMGIFLRWIRKQPTIEAEPVVRCGDCKWYKKSKRYGYYRCGNPCEGMASGVELMPYDYCSYGERRSGNATD